ncbi:MULTISPECIES: hypothetical protein [unclassified Bradyrhizobium]|uniref:hypothetical protein n=1 Tax=unclassified Bradyrhizobium TaxID=2631580 RepID=UPI0020B45DBA|nr:MULTISPECIES: hypothetical protein [unclassified Bradyrhizobium]MCP3401996.1 hypothetical protein [Bradyrhizobium sp. CCGB20]MCP3410481.1 hypothetical protein [Bradyrhizobium sp. CCGB01]
MSTGRKADRRSDGWNLATALGLLAVAFLWDRIAPPEKAPRTKDDAAFSTKEDNDRHASPAELATESEAADATPRRPRNSRAGMKGHSLAVYGNIGEPRVLALAAGMTYYSLLAIFPAIAPRVAIYGIFSDPGSIATRPALAWTLHYLCRGQATATAPRVPRLACHPRGREASIGPIPRAVSRTTPVDLLRRDPHGSRP